MKKVILGIAAMGMITAASAQKMYLQGGVNFANITTGKNGEQDNKALATFNAGVLTQFGLSKMVDLETGLLFTGKGSKAETKWNGGNDYVIAKTNPLYIELPLNLMVKIPLQNTASLFVYGGPYGAVGVGGKTKLESKILGITSSSESKIKFNDDDPTTTQQEDAAYDKLKRFDFGANVGAGIDFGKFIIKGNYGLGFAKINSTDAANNSDNKNKFRTASISIGIPIGGR